MLNEPIRPVRFPGEPDLDGYEPRLREFYEAAIREIRGTGDRHLVALEGKHWATDLSIFDHRYDDQMVLHFHRDGVPPEMESLRQEICSFLQAKDPCLSIHDFRMVRGTGHSNLIFDIAMPHSMAEEKTAIQAAIEANLEKTYGPHYKTVITFDLVD